MGQIADRLVTLAVYLFVGLAVLYAFGQSVRGPMDLLLAALIGGAAFYIAPKLAGR